MTRLPPSPYRHLDPGCLDDFAVARARFIGPPRNPGLKAGDAEPLASDKELAWVEPTLVRNSLPSVGIACPIEPEPCPLKGGETLTDTSQSTCPT